MPKKRNRPNGQKQIAFVLNNQNIEYSYYMRVIKIFGKWEADRIFFRARNANNIKRWISAGTKKGFALSKLKEEDSCKDYVDRWVRDNIEAKAFPKTFLNEHQEIIKQKVDRHNRSFNRAQSPESITNILDDITRSFKGSQRLYNAAK